MIQTVYASVVAALLLLGLSNCSALNSTAVDSAPETNERSDTDSTDIAQQSAPRARQPVLWSSNFEEANWQTHWQVRKQRDWGLENLKIISDPSGRFDKVLRVRYPAKSASPSVARKHKVPIGGGQFLADLGLPAADKLHLSYYVRFSNDFDYVKGGKLPGLFGGDNNSGGKIPDGTDGFSTRFMWRRQGAGEVYAYLPTSEKHGTSLGRGNWQFKPGTWHRLEQTVILNRPGQEDGRVQVWLDGRKVLDRSGLTFRSTDDLKIEGVFFSTFFGGDDPSWATPEEVYVDFADFSVATVD